MRFTGLLELRFCKFWMHPLGQVKFISQTFRLDDLFHAAFGDISRGCRAVLATLGIFPAPQCAPVQAPPPYLLWQL